MRLSDAIRLGSLLRPKVSGFFFKNGASCVQGAALEATGTVYTDDVQESVAHHLTLIARWPWVKHVPVPCPACGVVAAMIYHLAHLNNRGLCDHDWTREQIADWVESIERASGVQADDDSTEIIDARAPALDHPHGGDREKDLLLV